MNSTQGLRSQDDEKTFKQFSGDNFKTQNQKPYKKNNKPFHKKAYHQKTWNHNENTMNNLDDNHQNKPSEPKPVKLHGEAAPFYPPATPRMQHLKSQLASPPSVWCSPEREYQAPGPLRVQRIQQQIINQGLQPFFTNDSGYDSESPRFGILSPDVYPAYPIMKENTRRYKQHKNLGLNFPRNEQPTHMQLYEVRTIKNDQNMDVQVIAPKETRQLGIRAPNNKSLGKKAMIEKPFNVENPQVTNVITESNEKRLVEQIRKVQEDDTKLAEKISRTTKVEAKTPKVISLQDAIVSSDSNPYITASKEVDVALYDMYEATVYISDMLQNRQFAFIGSASLFLHGHHRFTDNIDILINSKDTFPEVGKELMTKYCSIEYDKDNSTKNIIFTSSYSKRKFRINFHTKLYNKFTYTDALFYKAITHESSGYPMLALNVELGLKIARYITRDNVSSQKQNADLRDIEYLTKAMQAQGIKVDDKIAKLLTVGLEDMYTFGKSVCEKDHMDIFRQFINNGGLSYMEPHSDEPEIHKTYTENGLREMCGLKVADPELPLMENTMEFSSNNIDTTKQSNSSKWSSSITSTSRAFGDRYHRYAVDI